MKTLFTLTLFAIFSTCCLSQTTKRVEIHRSLTQSLTAHIDYKDGVPTDTVLVLSGRDHRFTSNIWDSFKQARYTQMISFLQQCIDFAEKNSVDTYSTIDGNTISLESSLGAKTIHLGSNDKYSKAYTILMKHQLKNIYDKLLEWNGEKSKNKKPIKSSMPRKG